MSKKRSIANLLVATSNPVYEADLIQFILSELDPKFSPFITSIHLFPVAITVVDLLSNPLQEEEHFEFANQ